MSSNSGKGGGKGAKNQQKDYDFRDFSKPYPIGMRMFCKHVSDGKYHGIIVIDRRKHDPITGAIIEDPDLEEYVVKPVKKAVQRGGRTNKSKRKQSVVPEIVEEDTEPVEVNQNHILFPPNQVHQFPDKQYPKNHHYTYYVHYVQWDRRMDHWTTPSEMSPIEFVPDSMVTPLIMPYLPSSRESELPPMVEKKRGETRKQKYEREITNVQNVMYLISHGDFSLADILAHEDATKVKNVSSVVLGKHLLTAWYYSPYTPDIKDDIYCCEYCLVAFVSLTDLGRHMKRCHLRHPPGNEIYRKRDGNLIVSAFEVDGALETIYCQNLSLLAKLFLDHKTLEWDTSPFLFYVVCQRSANDPDEGYHMVGFFSKEKESTCNYNLACILALPCYQGMGYGKFLISLSYELSKIEKRLGSPEKPISDLGRVSYNSYWSHTLLTLLATLYSTQNVSIKELAHATSIEPQDIIDTLKNIGVLVSTGEGWVFSQTKITELLEVRNLKRKRVSQLVKEGKLISVQECDGRLLRWTPFNRKLAGTNSNSNIVGSGRISTRHHNSRDTNSRGL